MRRCTIHGTEQNCAAVVILPCSGVVHERPSEAQVLAALEEFRESAETEREKEKAKLIALGHSEPNAELILDTMPHRRAR